MAELKVTNYYGRARGKHRHTIFIDEETGIGFCTSSGAAKSNHTHEVKYFPPQPPEPIIDPQSGQPIVNPETGEPINPETGEPIPGTPGVFVLEPGPDGHTHEEILNYEPRPKKDTKPNDAKKTEILEDQFELYRIACENEGPSIKSGHESMAFYKGEQWDRDQVQYLKDKDRACVTVNKIEKGINTLSGFQRENKEDLQYLPVESGDELTAEIITKVVKMILTNCNYQREKAEIFEDGIITGRGFFNIYVDKNENLQGDLKVERFNNDRVKCGPHEKINLSDAEYVFKETMYSLTYLKQKYPEHAEDLTIDFTNYLTGSYNDLEHVQHDIDRAGDQYQKSDNRTVTFSTPSKLGDTTMVDIGRKEYRVLERWMKVYEEAQVLAIPDFDFVINLMNWDKIDIRNLKEIPGSYILKKDVARMRVTKSCGNVLLSDENPATLPDNDFYTVPFYARLKNGEFWGKVEGAKDMQRELNQRRSQLIDIGNRMVTYGHFYDDDTFETPQDKTHFEDTSTTPGFLQKIGNIDRPPLKSEGIKFPAELVELAMQNERGIEEHMNIVVEPTNGPESGELLLQRKQQKLTSNEYLFDNLREAEKKVGKLLLGLVQKYYGPERMIRMLNADEETLGNQPMTNYREEDLIELLEAQDLLEYDLVVSETDYTPTTRLATQMMLSRLIEHGAPVGPDALIETASIPQAKKDQLLDGIAAQSEQSEMAANSTRDMELNKTLVAAGYMPPKIAEEYGITGQSPDQFKPEAQHPADKPMGAGSPKNSRRSYNFTHNPDGSKTVDVIEQGD